MRSLISIILLILPTFSSAEVSRHVLDSLIRAQDQIAQHYYQQARMTLNLPGQLSPEERGLVRYLTAACFLMEKQLPSALNELLLAEATGGLDPDKQLQVQEQIARLSFQIGDLQLSRTYYQQLLKDHPEHTGYWRSLSHTEYRLSDHAGAYRSINKAISLSVVPDSADFELRLSIEQALERPEAMIVTLAEMQNLLGPTEEWLRWLGHLQLQQGHIDESIDTLELALQHDMLSPADWRLLASLYYHQGAYQRSGELLELGIHHEKISPGPSSMKQLKQSWIAAENWDKVQQVLDEQRNHIEPQQWQLQQVQLLKKKQDWNSLIRLLESAEQLAADDWFELGYAHWRLADFNNAQKAWEQAVRQNPTHVASSWLNIRLVPDR